jgi:pimeloyl-ACP methyl ester carboxylesterase
MPASTAGFAAKEPAQEMYCNSIQARSKSCAKGLPSKLKNCAHQKKNINQHTIKRLFNGHLWDFSLTLQLGLLLSCTSHPTAPVTFKQLAAIEDSHKAGELLLASDLGLHRLDSHSGDFKDVLIAVHGFASRGYEWVYPLQHLGPQYGGSFFYRWNWNTCPQEAAANFQKTLVELVKAHPSIERVTIVSHSYGGVLASTWGRLYDAERMSHVHLVASPLAGYRKLDKLCPPLNIGPLPVKENLQWHQWRTQHQLDGAFKDLPVDPQIIPGGEIITLPARYKKHRLGHNRSLSWVAEQIKN